MHKNSSRLEEVIYKYCNSCIVTFFYDRGFFIRKNLYNATAIINNDGRKL